MEAQTRTNYLFSAAWWQSSIKIISSNIRIFILPASLMALSNISLVSWDSVLGAGIPLDTLDSDPQTVDKLCRLALILFGCGIFGFVAGLVSLNIWLVDLTTLARFCLSKETTAFSESLSEIRKQKKYLNIVWLIALLYLFIPVVVMSVLLALSELARLNLMAFGQPLIPIPRESVLPMNFAAGLLFLIVLDFSLLLIGLSAKTNLLPKNVNLRAGKLLIVHAAQILLLNVYLVLLNVIISAPCLIMQLFPAWEQVSKNLSINIACQIWFAISSLFTWPLSLMIFVEFLKPIIQPFELTQKDVLDE